MTSNIHQRLVIALLLVIVTLLLIIATQTAHAQAFPWSVQAELAADPGGSISFTKIDAPDTVHAMALGFGGSNIVVCRTTDGGASWDQPLQRWFKEFAMRDLSHPTPNVAVIVGDTMYRDTGLTVFYTRDGGDTWRQGWCDSCRYASGQRALLWNVSMCDSLNGIMSTFKFILARTTDGGATWRRIPDPTNGQESFYDLQCLSPSTYILNTGSIYRTTDSGKTWAYDPLVPGTHRTDFIDSLNGWASGDQGDSVLHFRVARTTDGGRTWDTLYDADALTWRDTDLRSISMADAMHGITVGGTGTWLYTTNGTTWQEGANIDSMLFERRPTTLTSVTYPHPHKAWATSVVGHILVYRPRTASAPIEPSSSASGITLDAFPNPITSGALSISITVPRSDRTQLSLVDLRGVTVATIEQPTTSIGTHRFTWSLPAGISAGVYFLRLVNGATVATVPVTVMH